MKTNLGGFGIPNKEIIQLSTLLILGASNAGKTSLLYRLYSGIFYEKASKASTRSLEQAKTDNVILRSINIREKELSSDEWIPMARDAIAIIFVVDVSTDQSIAEGIALYKEVIHQSPIRDVSQAIFGNKIDLRPYLATLLRDKFHRQNAWNSKINPKIYCISVLTTEGLRKSMANFMRKINISFHIPVFRK